MSLTFEQLTKILPGEVYWESGQLGSVQFTVKDFPVVESWNNQQKVKFVGVANDGEEIPFLVTKGMEHYGPNICEEPEYVNIKEFTISKQREEKVGRLSHHDINMFLESKNFKVADWGGSQNSVVIECEDSTGDDQFFIVGGPFEHFTGILNNDLISQQAKDLQIQGMLRGILFAMENITCHDSFIHTE